MKYSNQIITDDNYDIEMERLADENGFGYCQSTFVKKLSGKFNKQVNEHGYEEWVCQTVKPNHCIDCLSPIIEADIAYEFGNGFIVFHYRDSMWD